MPISESKKRAIVKYKNNFDFIKIRLSMDKYECIQKKAESKGMSMSAYIVKLLEEA